MMFNRLILSHTKCKIEAFLSLCNTSKIGQTYFRRVYVAATQTLFRVKLKHLRFEDWKSMTGP